MHALLCPLRLAAVGFHGRQLQLGGNLTGRHLDAREERARLLELRFRRLTVSQEPVRPAQKKTVPGVDVGEACPGRLVRTSDGGVRLPAVAAESADDRLA